MCLRFLLLILCLCGCSQRSPDYFQERGRAITLLLVEELQQVDDVDALLCRLPYIESLFESLVDLMIEARKWQQKHKESWHIVDPDSRLNEQFALELNRVMRIPLAAHFIEKSQQKALERLDAFEKKSGLQ